MRRILIVILTLICAFFVSMTCYAATEILTENKQSVSVYVAADFEKNTSDPERFYCKVNGGKASVTLADGVTVSVSGIRADGLTLVVMPITKAETEAWEWFESCLENYGTNLLPVDIYFIDENGNSVKFSGSFSVSVTTSDKYTEPSVFYLSPDGKVTIIKCTSDGKTVTFETDHNSYYVIAEKVSQIPSNSHSPKTGDKSNMPIWIALLLVSGTTLVEIYVFGRKKDTE